LSQTESSLYVSQGCKFACDFCAAARTTRDPSTGELKKVTESYRSPGVIKEDLDYLVRRAEGFGIGGLEFYMSNLDVFQTPRELSKFAEAIKEVRGEHPRFKLGLRGLATVDSFLKARKTGVIEEMAEAGFHTVGFGVDGWGKEVWRKVKKGHNSEERCLEAIRSAREDYKITPEILMVFGHEGADTEESLRAAYEITSEMISRYGTVPRPHASKLLVPGNEGWKDPRNKERVGEMIRDPKSLQSIDFTTEPEDELAKRYYLEMCDLPGNTTQPTKPITPDMSKEEIKRVKKFNEGKFDR